MDDRQTLRYLSTIVDKAIFFINYRFTVKNDTRKNQLAETCDGTQSRRLCFSNNNIGCFDMVNFDIETRIARTQSNTPRIVDIKLKREPAEGRSSVNQLAMSPLQIVDTQKPHYATLPSSKLSSLIITTKHLAPSTSCILYLFRFDESLLRFVFNRYKIKMQDVWTILPLWTSTFTLQIMFTLHNTANASILKVANIFFGHCINISDMKKLGNVFTMKCILHTAKKRQITPYHGEWEKN